MKDDFDKLSVSSSDSQLSSHAECDLDSESDVDTDSKHLNIEDGLPAIRFRKKDRSLM